MVKTMGERVIQVQDRQIHAVAHLRPEGAHLCEINLGGPNDILLSVGDIPRVEAALRAFRQETTFDDGRNYERRSNAFKALGEF